MADRICPNCGAEMRVESEKYVNAIIWLCDDCDHEIFICDGSC